MALSNLYTLPAYQINEASRLESNASDVSSFEPFNGSQAPLETFFEFSKKLNP